MRRETIGTRGEVLFAQGAAFTAVFLVRSGCLKLSETCADGVDRIVGFRLPGEMVGLEGLDSGRYPFRAEALSASAVCRLQWTMSPDPPPGPHLLQRVLTKTVGQVQQSQKPWPGLPAADQVAQFLENFSLRTTGVRMTLPMTRAEIGSYLGMAEETVVRAMRRIRVERPYQTRSSGTAKSL